MASVCLPHESGTLSQRKHHRKFSRLIVSAVPFSPLWACHLEIACLPFFWTRWFLWLSCPSSHYDTSQLNGLIFRLTLHVSRHNDSIRHLKLHCLHTLTLSWFDCTLLGVVSIDWIPTSCFGAKSIARAISSAFLRVKYNSFSNRCCHMRHHTFVFFAITAVEFKKLQYLTWSG